LISLTSVKRGDEHDMVTLLELVLILALQLPVGLVDED
jgi:hypothetical protein